MSAHRSGEGERTKGTSIGAMRMRAPLPADGAPHSYQGASPCLTQSSASFTADPPPKICSRANRCATRSGTKPPSCSIWSSVQKASCVSSDGEATVR